MKLSTVINSPPIKVTAHKGIDSKNPQLSTAVIISCGNTVVVAPPKLADVIIVDITPCIILNTAISSPLKSILIGVILFLMVSCNLSSKTSHI